MEKWEQILRQSDAKVRNLPPQPEHWERLAADLAKVPPIAPDATPPGSFFRWRWWIGSAITVALLAVASYAIFTGPATPEGRVEPAVSAANSSGEPGGAYDGFSLESKTAANSDPASEERTGSSPAAESFRRGGGLTPLTAPPLLPPQSQATNEGSTSRSATASRGESAAASRTVSNSDSAKKSEPTLPGNSSAQRIERVQRPEPAERHTPEQRGAVARLATPQPQAVAIPPQELPALATPARPREQHWRLSLSWGAGSYDFSPWVPFYRLNEEIPNQESILPEKGPEELFLVGEFQAFEAEVINQHYRFSPEYRIDKQWLVYGGLRHQRTVYRLDDEHTNYLGTEADLLFRGRIRYRETGVEAGLIYQIKPFRWGLADVLNILEVRAGAYYATERARIFDGTLRARELPAALPFRHREELLPRYRWGFNVEILDRIRLSDRMDLYLSTGLFSGSDGVVRYIPVSIGLLRQL